MKSMERFSMIGFFQVEMNSLLCIPIWPTKAWDRSLLVATGRVPRAVQAVRGDRASPVATRTAIIAATGTVCVQSGLSKLFNYSAIQRVWGMCPQIYKEEI